MKLSLKIEQFWFCGPLKNHPTGLYEVKVHVGHAVKQWNLQRSLMILTLDCTLCKVSSPVCTLLCLNTCLKKRRKKAKVHWKYSVGMPGNLELKRVVDSCYLNTWFNVTVLSVWVAHAEISVVDCVMVKLRSSHDLDQIVFTYLKLWPRKTCRKKILQWNRLQYFFYFFQWKWSDEVATGAMLVDISLDD